MVNMCRDKFGLDHLATLTEMGNLAVMLAKGGRHTAAEKIQVRLLEAVKERLGLDHQSTLIYMSNLARIWRRQGRKAEALDLMRKCAQGWQRSPGSDHPRYIVVKELLATWETEDVNTSTEHTSAVGEGTDPVLSPGS